MSNDIDLWVQSNLSTNDYNKVSSVENVWLSNGSRYIRIPGSYIDARNIYYKNRDGELFGIGDVANDNYSYKEYGSYSTYFGNLISNNNSEGILYADKVENGVTKTVCVLPSEYIDSNVYSTNSWSTACTVSNGEIIYTNELSNCLDTIFTIGKIGLDVRSLNLRTDNSFNTEYNLLQSWNLGRYNIEFEYNNDEVDSISPILPAISNITFTEITTDYIPNKYDNIWGADNLYNSEFSAFAENYDFEFASMFVENFRACEAYDRSEQCGYPVIGELKDTLNYVQHDDNTVFLFSGQYGPCPFLHQPFILTNRVGKTVTLVHAPDIVAYSVINFGDGSDPVVIYTNPKSYSTELLSGEGYSLSAYIGDTRSFESILYRERDYRGVHTYRNNGTYTISADMYYFGTQVGGSNGYSSGTTNAYCIHATKTIVIDDTAQDLIYFKIPKNIPHLYVNGYRCPVVSTDDTSNTVALNVTGYNFEAYAKIAYSICPELVTNVDYATLETVDSNDYGYESSNYAVYRTSNFLTLSKHSFRVSVCELDDVRKSVKPLIHVCKNDREDLMYASGLDSILSIFGESCGVDPNYSDRDKLILVGPQCIGKTYDLTNLIDWSHLYMNYYPELMSALSTENTGD